MTGDDLGRSTDRAAMEAIFRRGLERTVRLLTLAGKRVVLVAPVPEAAFSVPRMMAELRLSGHKRIPFVGVRRYRRLEGFVLGEFARMQHRYGAVVVHPERALCGPERCMLAREGRPLYRDEHHLSVFGAMQLAPVMAAAFAPDRFIGD